MRRKWLSSMLAASAVCLAAPALTLAGERLTNDELKEFYTDKTLKGIHHKNGPGKTYYGADGTVHSVSDSGKERIGEWWIDESTNLRCIRWTHKDEDLCHVTERNEDGTHSLIHGKKGKELVIFLSDTPGNQM